MKKQSRHFIGQHGFTVLEVLGTVLLISLLSTLGIAALHQQQAAAERTKLIHQVHALNSAVQTYHLAGGDLTGLISIEDVLTKLKSRAPDGQQQQISGIREALIDPRLVSLPMTETETATGLPRAIWVAESKRFAVVTSGEGGARQFIYEESASEKADTSPRKLSVELAKTGQWIWDYKNQSASASFPAEGIAVGGRGGSDEFPTQIDPSSDPTTNQLLPPGFSIPGGEWNYPEFQDLVLDLLNPNPSGSSVIHYSVNDGPWTLHSGPIQLEPNQTIRAYTQSLDPLSFLDSGQEMQNYLMIPLLFSGESSGNFETATGAVDMVVTYTNDGESTMFAWGDASPDQSWLHFVGDAFNDVAAGQRFDLGTLNYHNGTIHTGSEAWNVNLSLEIEFLNPSITETFGFSFDLNNTLNYGNDANEDADYVTISNLLSNFQTSLNGIEYALQLQFGYEGTDGFATVDEFHVHEGSSAVANIYGLFVEVENGR